MRAVTPLGRGTLCPSVAAVLLFLARAAAAGVITVEGDCTLVDAMTAANTDAPAGGCPAGSGADEIHLTADVVLTEVDNTANGAGNGLPSVVTIITVVGNGFGIERLEGAPPFRIFHVGETGALELVDVAVTNGSVPGRGGGVYVSEHSSVTLTASRLAGNSSHDIGGGVFAGGTVVIRDGSSVSGNVAKVGGGIGSHISGASIAILDSVVSGNVANTTGGGIRMGPLSDPVTIHNSTLSGNQAARGGAIAMPGESATTGSLTVTNSTFSGNSASLNGGALWSGAENDGVSIVNSTFSGNSAASEGGAIRVEAGVFEITHSTLSGNSAPMGGALYSSGPDSATLLVGTIVAHNGLGGACFGSEFDDGGANFDDDGTCPGALPITPGIDYDTVLADNGGPTSTHALLEGSVAADAAGACGLGSDQRGFLREDGSCDSGSYELGGGKPGLRMSVAGMTLRRVACINSTTGQSGTLEAEPGLTAWTCDELGVATGPGDRVQLAGSGLADGSSAVGGSVNEFPSPTGYRVTCRNLTTSQTLEFASLAEAWNCEAQGLVVAAGDRIWQGVAGQIASALTFEEHLISSSVRGPVLAADLDGDGDADVLADSGANEEIAWFENDGGHPPAFTLRIITTSANEVRSLDATDMDGDGDVDLVLASADDDKVVWYENNGGSPPGFVERIISSTAAFAWSVHVADLDGDGDPDVLSANRDQNQIAWYESDGGAPPLFTPRLVGGADDPWSVYAADVDGDGDTDVLSASEDDDTIAWYENDGSSPPGFAKRIISATADFAHAVFATDVDGDGDTDVISGSAGDDTIAWYENGGGSPPGFTQRIVSAITKGARAVYAADIDGDGDTDVLSASDDDAKIAWYENDGAPVPAFTERVLSSTANSAESVHAADVDGDGDTDVLGGWIFGVAWFEHLVDGADPEPGVPK